MRTMTIQREGRENLVLHLRRVRAGACHCKKAPCACICGRVFMAVFIMGAGVLALSLVILARGH